MKNPVCLLLVLFAVCFLSPVLFSDYEDGYITEGEYEYVVEWNSKEPPLIVEGGGGIGLRSEVKAGLKCDILQLLFNGMLAEYSTFCLTMTVSCFT